MSRKKGGEVIAEYLVKQKTPFVFGVCGHGNVGILDALYQVRDKVALISPRHEQAAGHMADAYFRVKHSPVATLTSTGPAPPISSCPPRDGAVGFFRLPRHHRKRSDVAGQSRAVPGTLRPQPVRFRTGAAARREALFPAELRRDAAARLAPGVRHDGDGAARPVNLDIPQRFPGRGGCRDARAVARHGGHRPSASDADMAAAVEMIAQAKRPVFVGKERRCREAGPEISANCSGAGAFRSSPRRTAWVSCRRMIR